MNPTILSPAMGEIVGQTWPFSLGWLFGIYGISTLVGHLTPNSVYIYIYIYIYTHTHTHIQPKISK